MVLRPRRTRSIDPVTASQGHASTPVLPLSMQAIERILVVDDDADIRQLLSDYLTHAGYKVAAASSGAEMHRQLGQQSISLVVLDVMMPGEDGLSLCRDLHARGGPPVILLTARGALLDRIIGLEMGADDYLPKPFDLDELEARIRALRRRSHGVMTDMGLNPQQIGGLRFEPANGAIYNRAELLELTPRELALLKALMMKPGHAVTKERLFELVFPGETEVQYEAIEVVVYRLRKKLVGTGAVLMTMRGLGYLLRPEA